MLPAWNFIAEACEPPEKWKAVEKKVGGAGVSYPTELVEAARKELTEFIHILEIEGVNVRHIQPANYAASYGSPN